MLIDSQFNAVNKWKIGRGFSNQFKRNVLITNNNKNYGWKVYFISLKTCKLQHCVLIKIWFIGTLLVLRNVSRQVWKRASYSVSKNSGAGLRKNP